jgi:hypothetical protein
VLSSCLFSFSFFSPQCRVLCLSCQTCQTVNKKQKQHTQQQQQTNMRLVGFLLVLSFVGFCAATPIYIKADLVESENPGVGLDPGPGVVTIVTPIRKHLK